jgi:hypothetical protein
LSGGGGAARVRNVAAALLVLLLAGCLAPAARTLPHAGTLPAPTFSRVEIVDPVRSGGEPVLFQSPQGTLFIAAHPGYTHVKPPPGPEVLQESNGQSYLYRSVDDGAAWTVVTGANGAPRNDAPGDSDPDIAVTPDGSRLVLAQLDGAGVSTEASTDDGKTWPSANPLAAMPQDGNPDRPWLANVNGTFLLLYNGDGNGHWRLQSSPDGVSWAPLSTPGDGSYPGAMAVGPDGSVYVGDGDKVWSSTDGGKTFASSKIPGDKPMTGIMAQRPAVDAAGTVYFAWSELHKIRFAASHDDGKTWGPAVTLDANGTAIWPWPAAGAPGDLAVAWLGTNETNDDPSAVRGEWDVHLALVTGADTDHPSVWTGVIPNAVAMRGGICVDGTICEAEGKDRRLGDFITVIVDRDGYAQVAYGTTVTGHSISSPAYVRETDGPKLR